MRGRSIEETREAADVQRCGSFHAPLLYILAQSSFSHLVVIFDGNHYPRLLIYISFFKFGGICFNNTIFT